jgi:hypothetical protein
VLSLTIHLIATVNHRPTIGRLTIIDNHKLKDLILKGPKNREPTKVNWVKNKSMIFDAVDLYAKKVGETRKRGPFIVVLMER